MQNEILFKALEQGFIKLMMNEISSNEKFEALKATLFDGAGISNCDSIQCFLTAIEEALEIATDSNDKAELLIEKFNGNCMSYQTNEHDPEDFALEIAREMDDRQEKIDDYEYKLNQISDLASF